MFISLYFIHFFLFCYTPFRVLFYLMFYIYMLCICCVDILYLWGHMCLYSTKRCDLLFCDWNYFIFSFNKKKVGEKKKDDLFITVLSLT